MSRHNESGLVATITSDGVVVHSTHEVSKTRIAQSEFTSAFEFPNTVCCLDAVKFADGDVLVATTYTDCSARSATALWSLQRGKVVATLEGQIGFVTGLAFEPSSSSSTAAAQHLSKRRKKFVTTLVTVSDGETRFWFIAPASSSSEKKQHQSDSVLINAKCDVRNKAGQTAAFASSSPLASSEIGDDNDDHDADELCFGVAATSCNGTIYLWYGEDGKRADPRCELGAASSAKQKIDSLKFSHDGALLFFAASPATVGVIDVVGQRILAAKNNCFSSSTNGLSSPPSRPLHVALCRGSDSVLAVAGGNTSNSLISFWDYSSAVLSMKAGGTAETATSKLLRRAAPDAKLMADGISSSLYVTSLTCCSDGVTIVAGTNTRGVVFVDQRTSAVKQQQQSGSVSKPTPLRNIESVALLSNLLFVTASKTLQVYTLDTSEVVGCVPVTQDTIVVDNVTFRKKASGALQLVVSTKGADGTVATMTFGFNDNRLVMPEQEEAQAKLVDEETAARLAIMAEQQTTRPKFTLPPLPSPLHREPIAPISPNSTTTSNNTGSNNNAVSGDENVLASGDSSTAIKLASTGSTCSPIAIGKDVHQTTSTTVNCYCIVQ